MQLIGGDTTAGPLSMTGNPRLCACRARAETFGRKTGRLDLRDRYAGDSAAGLAILQNRLTVEDADDAAYR